jgi:hypothetical protein
LTLNSKRFLAWKKHDRALTRTSDSLSDTNQFNYSAAFFSI